MFVLSRMYGLYEKSECAYRTKIFRKQPALPCGRGAITLPLDIQSSDPLGKIARDFAGHGLPLAPIAIGQPIQQGRGCHGERDFEVQRQDFIIDSDHDSMRTNMEL